MKDIIKNIFRNKNGKISSRANLYIDKYEQEIISLTPKCISNNPYERIHWILNDIDDYPKCKICGKDNNIFLKQSTRSDGLRYTIYCSSKCRAHDPEVTYKMQTCSQNKWILLMNELKSIKELKQFINEYYFVYEPRQSFKGVKINGNISRVLTNNIKTLIDNNISVILKTENYTEKIYWLMNDLKEYPRSCKECNNPLTFFKGFGYDLRKEFCSCSCKATNIIKESHANGTFDTFMEARMKWKEYTLPSGKIIRVQGYEDKALNTLLQSYDEEEIVTQRKLIPAIWYYTLDGVRHRYYPDIFIPKDNLIIEVKSKFTMSMQKEKNMLKEQATKNAGYDFKFMIC